MAKGNSADKVARAAKAGASGATSENRRLGFPVAMACVVILGILLVGWSRSNREVSTGVAGDQNLLLKETQTESIHMEMD